MMCIFSLAQHYHKSCIPTQAASGIPMWGKTTDPAAIPDDAIYKCKVLDVKYIYSAITAKQEIAHASSNDALQLSGVGAACNNPFVQLTLEVSALKYIHVYSVISLRLLYAKIDMCPVQCVN
jgi:hypothetical protein